MSLQERISDWDETTVVVHKKKPPKKSASGKMKKAIKLLDKIIEKCGDKEKPKK